MSKTATRTINAPAFHLPAEAQAGYDFGKAEFNALAVIGTLTGENEEGVRRMFICGYWLSKIRGQDATQANWEGVLEDYSMSEKARVAKGGKKLQDDYRAACRAWSRLLKKHGMESSHGNAGNGNAKSKGTDKTAAPAPVAPIPAMPKAKGELTRAAYLAHVTETLVALISEGKGITGVETAAIKELETTLAKMQARAKIEK